jgi:rod shape-determining protein MreD
MMPILLALPILGSLVILQTAMVSQAQLLHGTADLILLVLVAWAIRPRVQTYWHWTILGGLLVSFVSALPFGVPFIGYGLTTALTLLFRRRVWKVPVLAMLTAVFFGTLITHTLSFVALWLTGVQLPLIDALNLVTLPSLVLNLLLAVPAYVLIGDLANWLYPIEVTV